MKEIKFRVYCEKHQRNEEYTLGDLVSGAATKAGGEGGLFKNWREFTGLHDKNGKEISEGDILSDGKGWGVVKYFVSAGGFMIHENNGTLNERGKEEAFYLNKGEFWNGRTQLIEGEIIGNVYENPELLTNKKK